MVLRCSCTSCAYWNASVAGPRGVISLLPISSLETHESPGLGPLSCVRHIGRETPPTTRTECCNDARAMLVCPPVSPAVLSQHDDGGLAIPGWRTHQPHRADHLRSTRSSVALATDWKKKKIGIDVVVVVVPSRGLGFVVTDQVVGAVHRQQDKFEPLVVRRRRRQLG